MILLLILATAALASAQTFPLPPDYAERLAVLEQARQARPHDLQVLDALAGSYSMAAEYRRAISVVQEMRTLAPEDRSLQLRLGRNYTWAGDSKRAIAEYNLYLRAKPEDRQATIELIRLRRYRGDYSQAEKLCNRLLATNPNDAEVLALKAEVLHWAGQRRFLARETADRAAAAAPAYPDAKISQVYAALDLGENRRASDEFAALQGQVDRQGGLPVEATYRDAYNLLEGILAHPSALSFTPGASVYNDSDGIHDSMWGWRLERRVAADHKLILDMAQYASSAPKDSLFIDRGESGHLSNFLAGGQARIGPAVYLTVLGGGSFWTSEGWTSEGRTSEGRSSDSALRPIYSAQITAAPMDRWTFDLSTGREFLSVTPRAIDRSIASNNVAAAIQYAFDSRTFVSVRADRRYWSDANQSILGEITLRRVLHYSKSASVEAGLLSHWEHFDRDMEAESGFFTPERYGRNDATLGLHGEWRNLQYDVRGSGGAQQVAPAAGYQPDWDFTSIISARLGRSLRLSADYERRNYSLVSRNGWYQGLHVSLGIRQ